MKITVERDYLVINDKPRFIYGGDFSYTRVPRRCWEERLQKMKSAGMNCVTFYCVWGYHELEHGKWDFSGERDLACFIDLIHRQGMFAICRMGPFVHGEWRNGGLPQWLIDELGSRVRTNDPEYLDITRGWYNKLIGIVLPRLFTKGGPIILVQLENELGSAGSKGDDIPRGSSDKEENIKHVLFYHNLIRESGFDVPVIDINHIPDKEKIIPNLVDTGGGYPVSCFYCDGELSPMSTEWWEKHTRPKITIETQSSVFARYFDWPPYKHTNGFQGPILAPEVVEAIIHQDIAQGANGVNLFVVCDGQHRGHYNERMLAANMNYQAPITAVGSLRESYKVCKRIGWFLRAFEQDVLRSHPNPEWARVMSYGISHPGLESGGDLFEKYGKIEKLPEHFSHITEMEALSRTTYGLNLSESNFLFIRNTKNHGTKWKRDIRILTNTNRLGAEVAQEYPKRIQMDLSPQSGRIMPFFIKLAQHAFLEYSTATPLDRRSFANGVQVILYAREDEIVESRLVLSGKSDIKSIRGTLSIWDSPNTLTLLGLSGSEMEIVCIESDIPVRYVLMEKNLAGDVWDLASPDHSIVVVSNLRFLDSFSEDNKTKAIVESDERNFYLYILSPLEPVLSGPFSSIAGEYLDEFGIYRAAGELDIPEKNIKFDHKKEGNNYILETEIGLELLEGLRDLVLEVKFDGTLGHAYLDGRLISDHPFGRYLTWEIGLRDYIKSSGLLRIVLENTRKCEIKARPVVSFEVMVHWKKK